MRHRYHHALLCTLLLCMVMTLSTTLSDSQAEMPTTPRADALMAKAESRVVNDLATKGLQLGQPVFMRIFKMTGELEVWIKKNGKYELFKTYAICNYSGYPGPKLYEGDWQSPEGFYTVSAEQMNPNSLYHLSFNVGYPNAFDKARKRTGSSIMVHGGCSSRGCFAMGNKKIEELYLLAQSALTRGQKTFSLHIFPFRMTSRNMIKFNSSPWIGFWKNLQQGYEAFEMSHQVPVITAERGKYLVNDQLKLAMTQDGKKRQIVIR
jgi:murein L,D-transpeptidase YafK